ncbi:MAG TPA: cupin domain-containing protein [Gaiellaceae bacterium]|nr:cupin domain-containing protein [Gaiellaceae bacterium]
MLVSPLSGRSAGSDDSGFVVVEWTDPGGETSRDRPIAPLHVHHADDECWYVLDGRLGFRVGGDELEAGPGDAVFVRAGTAHAYWNAQDGPTRYLLVIPRRIADLLHELHAPGAKDFAAVFRKYESELL